MTTILSKTRDQLLTLSIRKLGLLAKGQTPDATDLADAAVSLDTTIARFRTKGLPLWKRVEYSWTPTTNEYLIGIGQTLNTPYPLHILQAYREASGGARVPIDINADYDFNIFPTQSAGSVPLLITYTPFVNYGRIRLWPTSLADNTEEMTIIYHAPYDYADSSSDTFDFPEEWYDALVYDVAAKIAPEWGVPLEDRKALEAKAKEYLADAEQFGFEDASLYITPYRRPA